MSYLVELDRREVLVILAALRSFTRPPTDFDDRFVATASNVADALQTETGVTLP